MFSVLFDVDHVVDTSPTVAPFGNLILSTEETYGSIINYFTSDTSDRLTTEVTNQFDVVNDNTLSFTAKPQTENIREIVIDQEVYTLSLTDTPEAGEFTYNPETQEVIVNVVKPILATTVITYELSASNTSFVPTTDICPCSPEFILVKYNAYRDITISHAFQDHSSLSFSFVACKADYSEIENTLCKDVAFVAFGYTWIINSLSITLLKGSEQMVVSINARDRFAPRGNPSKSNLDKLIRIKDQGTSDLTAGQIAAFSGVNYAGSSISNRVSRDTSEEEVISLRQQLQDKAIASHSFLFYGANGVETRKWGQTRTHVINYSDVRGDIQIQCNPHLKQYRNLKVELDYDEDDIGSGIGGETRPGVTTRWVFENASSLADVFSPAINKGFYSEQPPLDDLRSPGINADSGGRVKRATKITELNGTVTFEEHWEYGYAFASSEVYEIVQSPGGNYTIRLKSGIGTQPYWKEIKKTTTDYVYDGDGYLTSIRTTGKQIMRLRQESDKLEAITALAKSILNDNDPIEKAKSEAYEFTYNLPINDVTNYELVSHSRYFDDTIRDSDPSRAAVCNTGTSSTSNIGIPVNAATSIGSGRSGSTNSKFAAAKYRNLSTKIVAPHPESTEEATLPPIVTGQYLSETEKTTITSSAYPYKFEHRTFAQNNEGEMFKNSIALGNVTQNTGKPGTQTRLTRNVTSRSSNLTVGAKTKYKGNDYYLSSPGVTGIKAQEGTKGYTDIDDPSQVKSIAETELSIENTQNGTTATIDILYREGLEVGDRVLFQGKTWVIFSISDNRQIKQGCLVSTGLQLSLGKLVHSSLNLEVRTACQGAGAANSIAGIVVPEPPLILPTPYAFYSFDGSLLDGQFNRHLTSGSLVQGVDYDFGNGHVGTALEVATGNTFVTSDAYNQVIGMSYSISAWIKSNAGFRFSTSANPNQKFELAIVIDSGSNTIDFQGVSSNGSGSSININYSGAIADSAEFHHIAVVRIDVLGFFYTTSYFVDGVEVYTSSLGNGDPALNDTGIFDRFEVGMIGSFRESAKIDQVRVYNRNLDTTEIETLAME